MAAEVEKPSWLVDIFEDHRMILTMSRDYRLAIDTGCARQVYGRAVDNLSAFCRGHFDFEEQALEVAGCALDGHHERTKGECLGRLEELRQKSRRRGYRRTDALDLVEFIDRWLADHVAYIERHIRAHVSAGSSLPDWSGR